MDFKTFQSNLKILDKQTGNTIRSKYINEFVNTKYEQYHQQIQLKHKFRDGYCYVGYLWDYIKNPIIIDKKYFEALVDKLNRVFVFWDIHSCERILIEDYWKFDKDSVIEIDFNVLLEGETYLPEDIYIFDKNMTWTLIKTHEDINEHCYCLKSGAI